MTIDFGEATPVTDTTAAFAVATVPPGTDVSRWRGMAKGYAKGKDPTATPPQLDGEYRFTVDADGTVRAVFYPSSRGLFIMIR